MPGPATSSWPLALRIASLAAIVGVTGWLIWQTQQQSNPRAPKAPSEVAVPPPAAPTSASEAAAALTPTSPAAAPPAPAVPAPLPAPETEPAKVAAEAQPEPEVKPGGSAKSTYFHSSKAMVLTPETLLGPKEPEVAPPPELIGRNPVFLHSSKAMMPSTLPSLVAPDAGSAYDGSDSDAAAPPNEPHEPIFIPSSKFADPALYRRLVEDEPPPVQQKRIEGLRVAPRRQAP